MKNLYILPTDKPTWLHKSTLTGILRKSSSCFNDMKQAQGMNIYITSNEEIKEGDWVLHGYILRHPDTQNKFNGDVNPVKKLINKKDLWKFSDGTNLYGSTCKKIILTTDQDLIEDGVQAIDDEFLEWFVKNPSCENVEVELETLWLNKRFGGTWQPFPDEEAIKKKKNYKIIIPKEEPKCCGAFYGCDKCQYKGRELSTEEVMQGRSSKYEFINFKK